MESDGMKLLFWEIIIPNATAATNETMKNL